MLCLWDHLRASSTLFGHHGDKGYLQRLPHPISGANSKGDWETSTDRKRRTLDAESEIHSVPTLKKEVFYERT